MTIETNVHRESRLAKLKALQDKGYNPYPYRFRPDAFAGDFTAEKFADVLFSLMLSAFLRQDYDPSTVLEIIRRTLYAIPAE